MERINGILFKQMLESGMNNLSNHSAEIDALNVFPVPDGDTGTNMTLTIMSASKEVSNIETPDMESLAKAISSGSLRGARGNSGVILSQLFRGFYKGVKDQDVLTTETVLYNNQQRYFILKKSCRNLLILQLFCFITLVLQAKT